MSAELVTIPGVELLEIGMAWNLSSGKRDFTLDDLTSAIQAQDDPAVRPPVVGFGHDDGRFDGEPGVGVVKNLRLSANKMTLIGDFMGVPKWIADAMPSAWPRRSIEADLDVTTETGHDHSLVLTAVKLLGTHYPAITTLKDVEQIYAAKSMDDVVMIETDIDAVTASLANDDKVIAIEGEPMPFFKKKLKASVAVSDVSRAYYDSLSNNEAQWCWIREIQLEPNQLIIEDDSDDGQLYQVPFTVTDEAVTFGDPEAVKVVYQPETVAASHGPQHRTVFATKDDSVADTVTDKQGLEKKSMTPDQLKAINLPEDATDEQINERFDALVALETAQASASVTGENDDTESDDSADDSGEGSDEGAQDDGDSGDESPGIVVPEGHVLVNASQFKELQLAASRANDLWLQKELKERDDYIVDALKAGKIAPAQRKQYENVWASNPKAARELLDALAPNVIPVQEVGHADADDGADDETAYPTQFLTKGELAAKKAREAN